MDKKKILAAGGDIRMLYAAAELSDRYDVEITGFSPEKIPDNAKEILREFPETEKETDILLLPPVVIVGRGKLNAPFSEREIETAEMIGKVKKGGTVLMGIKGEVAAESAGRNDLYYYNYMEDSILALANAVPTAEGAMKIIMAETGRTIWGSRILVTGFGKTGSVLTDRLLKMGAHVTTAARKEYDRMRIKTMGGRAAEICSLAEHLPQTEVIINTVPARIFGEKEFSQVKKGCIYLELASYPGGADKKDAEKFGVKHVCASGIPAGETGLHIEK